MHVLIQISPLLGTLTGFAVVVLCLVKKAKWGQGDRR